MTKYNYLHNMFCKILKNKEINFLIKYRMTMVIILTIILIIKWICLIHFMIILKNKKATQNKK